MRSNASSLSSGRENVWDYPRPPRLEPTAKHLRIEFAGRQIAETRAAFRVLETSHPPVYYLPPADIHMDCLSRAEGRSFCEWKGSAAYYDLAVGDRRLARAAWFYPDPTEPFEPIRNYVAFYPGFMDACFVEGERVIAQPGDFYGGWITSDLDGPFKGAPGTRGW